MRIKFHNVTHNLNLSVQRKFYISAQFRLTARFDIIGERLTFLPSMNIRVLVSLEANQIMPRSQANTLQPV